MNKTKQILFALVCAFFLFGCNGAVVEKTKSPTETMKALYEASKKKDVAEIKSYLSKGTLDMLEQSAKRQEKTVDELLKQENGAPFQNLPEIRNEQITGETASLEVKSEAAGGFEKIPFVRENGVWKVALDVFMKDTMKRLNDEMNQMPANVAGNGEPKKSESGNSNAKTENK